jgi:hypothetical protein
MPSHIFLALGMWDGVASSNEAAWAASDARMKRKRLAMELRDYHSLWWLQYAYLQQGRWREARRLVEQIQSDTARTGSPRLLWHFALMRAAQIVETQRWLTAAEIAVNPAGLGRVAAATDLFASAYAALRLGDVERVEAALVGTEAMAAPPRAGGSHGHASHDSQEPSNEAIVTVLILELKAAVRLARGDAAGAVALMERAAGTEIEMSYEFGPPLPVKPANEMFGELLLELKRPAEARKQVEISLQRAPGRALSLLGLARAASRTGDRAAAARAARELLRIWRRADPGMPWLAEVRRVAGPAPAVK